MLEPFLCDAEERAVASGRRAYCHLVGLGLGVWMVTPKQGKLQAEVYHKILCSRCVCVGVLLWLFKP